MIEELHGPIRTEDYKGKLIVAWSDPAVEEADQIFSPSRNLVVSAPRARLIRDIDNPAAAKPPVGASQWVTEAKGPVFAVLDLSAIKKGFSDNLLRGPMMQMFKPILDSADQATFSVEDGDPLSLKLSFSCGTPEAAARVEQTLQAAIVVLKNVVASQRDQFSSAQASDNPNLHVGMLPVLEFAGQLLNAAKVTVVDARVDVFASLNDPAKNIGGVVPVLRASLQASQRAQSQNNLKQLALAALNYADRHNGYPPAVVYGESAFPQLNASGDKKSHVPRSWRVELLPLLGYEELYKQYRLDEPWDSEANLRFLQAVPAVYRSPFDRPQSTNASYFAVTGPGTVFDGNEGTPVVEIRDGLSNTLLWVEAKREIPWTKPEDIAYEADQPVPNLGGWQPDVFLVALCDGSVHPVRSSEWVDKTFLRPWIEKSDGQVPPPLWTPEPAR